MKSFLNIVWMFDINNGTDNNVINCDFGSNIKDCLKTKKGSVLEFQPRHRY